jgi:hypothetical protein
VSTQEDFEDTFQGPDRRRREKWHVGKEIPIAFVLTIVAQTAIFVWNASKLDAKVEYVVDQLKQFAAERYTREDARRDREMTLLLVDQMKTRDVEMERRMLKCEQVIENGGVRK